MCLDATILLLESACSCGGYLLVNCKPSSCKYGCGDKTTSASTAASALINYANSGKGMLRPMEKPNNVGALIIRIWF